MGKSLTLKVAMNVLKQRSSTLFLGTHYPEEFSYNPNQTRAGPKTIFWASEGGAEHILLSNKGRNLCASVCLLAFLLCREPFIQSTSHIAGVLLRTQGSAVSQFGAIWTRDTFRVNKLLINVHVAQW